MRRILTGSLLMLMAALPAAAQFEGTISMKTTSMGGKSTDVKYMVKGNKIAYTAQSPMSPRTEGRVIIDMESHKMTMLMPMAMGNAKGMMMTMDMNQAAGNAGATPPVVKDLGTSEMLVGHKCEDFEVTDGKTVTRVCMASDLGRFAFAGSNMGRGRSNDAPQWIRAFGDKPGFPLKVWTTDGKVSWEVTGIEKGSVPDAMFTVPDGYQDMSGMMGGRGVTQ